MNQASRTLALPSVVEDPWFLEQPPRVGAVARGDDQCRRKLFRDEADGFLDCLGRLFRACAGDRKSKSAQSPATQTTSSDGAAARWAAVAGRKANADVDVLVLAGLDEGGGVLNVLKPSGAFVLKRPDQDVEVGGLFGPE
jgi:hypothetical protein